jgi:hypothetical protein
MNAATQPIKVQPRKRFRRKMLVASALFLPRIAGRKYRNVRTRRLDTTDLLNGSRADCELSLQYDFAWWKVP